MLYNLRQLAWHQKKNFHSSVLAKAANDIGSKHAIFTWKRERKKEKLNRNWTSDQLIELFLSPFFQSRENEISRKAIIIFVFICIGNQLRDWIFLDGKKRFFFSLSRISNCIFFLPSKKYRMNWIREEKYNKIKKTAAGTRTTFSLMDQNQPNLAAHLNTYNNSYVDIIWNILPCVSGSSSHRRYRFRNLFPALES